MLIPKVEINNKTLENNSIKVKVDENLVYDYNDLYFDINSDENKKEKFFKYIEKIIRNSYEYKQYIYALKNEFELTNCKFFKNIDTNKTNISLEFHHYPFTLYDIVNIVYNTLIEDFFNSKNPYFIADNVMKLHYENKIGLVPLTKTVHELVHNGDLFIPLDNQFVFGNYNSFMKSYNYKIDNYEEKISTLLELTNKYRNNLLDLDINSKLSKLEIEIEMTESLKPQIIKTNSESMLA